MVVIGDSRPLPVRPLTPDAMHRLLCFFFNHQTGMPDDCTVLVLHVVGRDAMDVMDAPGM